MLLLAILMTSYGWLQTSKARSVLAPQRDAAMWTPEPGGPHASREEWMRCHGMPCDQYDRIAHKLAMLKLGAAGEDIDLDPMKINNTELLADDSLDGCIWLNEEQVDVLLDQMRDEHKHKLSDEGSMGNRRQKRKVLDFNTFSFNQWPLDKPIVWKFDGAHNELEKIAIREGFNQWAQHTCIRFREIGVNENHNDNHILVTRATSGCHSFVGRQSSFPQQLNLQSPCVNEIGIIIHEIGHALGLWHEQQRPDRNSTVRVNIDNVREFLKGQFLSQPFTNYYGVPYDTTSVMHYKHKDGSINGLPVMETLDPLYQHNMGQRIGLSFFDAKIINKAYCSETCQNILPQPCAKGGYQDPNDCGKCKCPDGYSGNFCEQIAPPINAGCGGILFIAPGGQELIIQSPGYDSPGFYNNLQECSWIIKTVPGHSISLEFIDEFSLHCHYQDVCYHWVEVKYGWDLGQAGPRFCCNRRPSVVLSDTEEMVVIFKSPWQEGFDRNRRGFRAVLKTVGIQTTSKSTVYTTATSTTSISTTPTQTTMPVTTTTSTHATTLGSTTMVTTNPESGCSNLDLMFILDSSGSVMRENWDTMIRFVSMAILAHEIGPSNTRVGVVSFGNKATLEVSLDQYNDVNSLLDAISKIQWKDQFTNTPDGLRLAEQEFIAAHQRGSRRIAIVITDGEANVQQDMLETQASSLETAGVEAFVIGVGPTVNYLEAEIIARGFLNVIPVADFEDLISEKEAFTKRLNSRICGDYGEMGEDFSWSCFFEEDEEQGQFCGMSQNNIIDDFDWTLQTGNTPSDETGPSGASEGSYYMYIEASSPRRQGDVAIIYLPLQNRMGTACLTLDYNMHGFHMGSLRIVTITPSGELGPTLWALNGEQGPSWKKAKVQIHLAQGEQIGISGVRGTAFSSDIAVDNIIVVGGACLK